MTAATHVIHAGPEIELDAPRLSMEMVSKESGHYLVTIRLDNNIAGLGRLLYHATGVAWRWVLCDTRPGGEDWCAEGVTSGSRVDAWLHAQGSVWDAAKRHYLG